MMPLRKHQASTNPLMQKLMPAINNTNNTNYTNDGCVDVEITLNDGTKKTIKLMKMDKLIPGLDNKVIDKHFRDATKQKF